MFTWFATTLRQYPEIAIFLVLGLGYYFGKFTFRGIGLGSVTATLLAGVLVGQLGITIGTPLKATVFLMFLFAVGYGVGPQFVRGVAKDGLPQAIFSAVQCVLCLASPCSDLQVCRLRHGLFSRSLLRLPDNLRGYGPFHRRYQSTRARTRRSKTPARLDADRLRGNVHVRHGGVGACHRTVGTGIAPHGSRRRLQGL